MIKRYKDFIEEKYSITQNDPIQLASDKTYFNQMEENIKEFLTKKVTVDNIYMTYTDDKDLISKLSAQKFIPTNTSDKKQIKFNNPLIGLYADAAQKKRELKSLESDLISQKDTLTDRQSSITANPESADSIKNDISYTQTKISDINIRVQKIKNEIVTLERNTRDKLKEMKDDLANNKKKIDYFIKSP
jgi:chromosome segregation ATPase